MSFCAVHFVVDNKLLYFFFFFFLQSVDFNRCNRGNSAVPTVSSLLLLNATNIQMQLLPKLPTSIDRIIVNKKCNVETQST